MVKIDSGEVLEMRDERFQDLLDEINKKYNQTRLSVLMGGGFAALVPLLAFAAPLAATLTASGASLVAYVLGRWFDSYREIAPEVTGQGLPLRKCEAYDRPYDQHLGSR